MGYGVAHHFKGGTREQFEALTSRVDPVDGSLVAGELFEASGPSADGWVVGAAPRNPSALSLTTPVASSGTR